MREHPLRMARVTGTALSGPAVTCSAPAPSSGPGSNREALQVARGKAEAAFEFSQAGHRLLQLPRHRRGPREHASLADTATTLREWSTSSKAIRNRPVSGCCGGTANCFSPTRALPPAPLVTNGSVCLCGGPGVQRVDATPPSQGAPAMCYWGGHPKATRPCSIPTSSASARSNSGSSCAWWSSTNARSAPPASCLSNPSHREPTKHQYDYDSATVFGFLHQFGLEKRSKVNIEANHATRRPQFFHHGDRHRRVPGHFGSIDANRGDPQERLGHRPVPQQRRELTLVTYEVLKAGGFKGGGYNTSTPVAPPKPRRSGPVPWPREAAMDVLALSRRAAAMVQNDALEQFKAQRYAGAGTNPSDAPCLVATSAWRRWPSMPSYQLNPQAVSGRQENARRRSESAIYPRAATLQVSSASKQR